MPRYKWASPHEWLQWAIDNEKLSTKEVLTALLPYVDPEEIQGYFQEEMDRDGYFTPNLVMGDQVTFDALPVNVCFFVIDIDCPLRFASPIIWRKVEPYLTPLGGGINAEIADFYQGERPINERVSFPDGWAVEVAEDESAL